jgi:hypothetical protein
MPPRRMLAVQLDGQWTCLGPGTLCPASSLSCDLCHCSVVHAGAVLFSVLCVLLHNSQSWPGHGLFCHSALKSLMSAIQGNTCMYRLQTSSLCSLPELLGSLGLCLWTLHSTNRVRLFCFAEPHPGLGPGGRDAEALLLLQLEIV